MENGLEPVFLIERLERCLRLSDFGKGAWITQGSEGVFSGKMRNNTCSLVGGLISFDYTKGTKTMNEILPRASHLRLGLVTATWLLPALIGCRGPANRRSNLEV